MAQSGPITTSPMPPVGLIFTKASIIVRAPISISVPRTESSMSANGEILAVGSMRMVTVVPSPGEVRVGCVALGDQCRTGGPGNRERRIVPAHTGLVTRLELRADLVEHVGVGLQRQEAVRHALGDEQGARIVGRELLAHPLAEGRTVRP